MLWSCLEVDTILTPEIADVLLEIVSPTTEWALTLRTDLNKIWIELNLKSNKVMYKQTDFSAITDELGILKHWTSLNILDFIVIIKMNFL